MRCQTASELKTDLNRMKRDLESSKTRAKAKTDSDPGAHKQGKSVAVLYFENLSGAKEDEYLRDGITEDVITELSKIRGLNIFSRATVLAFRDQSVTPQQVRAETGRRVRADGHAAPFGRAAAHQCAAGRCADGFSIVVGALRS